MDVITWRILEAINAARSQERKQPINDLTEPVVRQLRSEAGQAGDADMVAVCCRWLEEGSDE